MPEKDDIEEIRWIKEAGRGWELYQKSFYEGMQCAIEAASHFKKAEKLLRESGDDFHLPLVLDGLGAASHILGTKDHLLTAVNYFDEEIKLLKTTGRLGEVPHVIGRQQAVYRDLALLEPEKGMVYLEKGLKAGEVALTLAADFKDERSLAWVSQTTADLCCVVARLDSTYLTSHLDVAIDLIIRLRCFGIQYKGG